jgi:hypothetical protein
MREQLPPETLDTLACELDRRPKNAPTIADLVASVRSLRREADTLIVEFEPTVADLVAAVVAAERQCCSTIGWHLDTDRPVQLRITARPMQLTTLEKLFSPLPPA